MNDFKNLLIDVQQQVAILTINRPDKLNALNSETIAELNRALLGLESDSNVRVVIITGSGNKAFVAGADISEFAHFSVEQGAELSRKGHETLFNLVENLSKPVIAAVNGFALGGGLELAMSCHIRVASANAKMGLPEVSLGVIPGYGGTQRLPMLVGRGRANQMMFTAEMVDGNAAAQIGLVNKCVDQESLKAECMAIAEKICKNSPSAISHAIRAINSGYVDGVNGFEAEIEEFGKTFGTKDFKEGTTAFLEKRKAIFTGE